MQSFPSVGSSLPSRRLWRGVDGRADPLRRSEALRRRLGPRLGRLAAEQAALRERACERFPSGWLRWLTRRGLEQSMRDAVARERARRSARSAAGCTVFDGTGGLGADARCLRNGKARRGRGSRCAGRPPLPAVVVLAERSPGACIELSLAFDMGWLGLDSASRGLAQRVSDRGELCEMNLWIGVGVGAEAGLREAVALGPEGRVARLVGAPPPRQLPYRKLLPRTSGCSTWMRRSCARGWSGTWPASTTSRASIPTSSTSSGWVRSVRRSRGAGACSTPCPPTPARSARA